MKRDDRFAYLVRCTKEERQLIRDAAKLERRTISQYVGECCHEQDSGQQTSHRCAKTQRWVRTGTNLSAAVSLNLQGDWLSRFG
jgi:hypothetical protein